MEWLWQQFQALEKIMEGYQSALYEDNCLKKKEHFMVWTCIFFSPKNSVLGYNSLILMIHWEEYVLDLALDATTTLQP